MNRLASTTLAGLALLTVSSLSAAQGLEPASVLVFPLHRGAPELTLLSVTNTHPTRSVRVTYRYLEVVPDPANPLRPLHCSTFIGAEMLTPNDTVSRVTECVADAGALGWVLVSARDVDTGCAVSHDRLVGSGLVIGGQGSRTVVTPIPFRSVLPEGSCTDVNTNGRIDFDGIEYETGPDHVVADSFLPILDSRLVLFPLVPDPAHTDVTVSFDVFNDNELPLSLTFTFRCYLEAELDRLSPLFTEAYLRGTPNDPTELDIDCDREDDLETGWFRVRALSASFLGGSLPDPVVLGALTGGAGSFESGRSLWNVGSRSSGSL